MIKSQNLNSILRESQIIEMVLEQIIRVTFCRNGNVESYIMQILRWMQWDAYCLLFSVRYQTYHNTFLDFRYVSTIQIWVEIPHEKWNIAKSIQKCDLPFTLTSFKSKQKSNIGGVVLRKTNVLCIFTSKLAKNN